MTVWKCQKWSPCWNLISLAIDIGISPSYVFHMRIKYLYDTQRIYILLNNRRHTCNVANGNTKKNFQLVVSIVSFFFLFSFPSLLACCVSFFMCVCVCAAALFSVFCVRQLFIASCLVCLWKMVYVATRFVLLLIYVCWNRFNVCSY